MSKPRKKHVRLPPKEKPNYSDRVKPKVLPVERVIIEVLEDYPKVVKANKALKSEVRKLKILIENGSSK